MLREALQLLDPRDRVSISRTEEYRGADRGRLARSHAVILWMEISCSTGSMQSSQVAAVLVVDGGAGSAGVAICPAGAVVYILDLPFNVA
jgi:hypothetical protein